MLSLVDYGFPSLVAIVIMLQIIVFSACCWTPVIGKPTAVLSVRELLRSVAVGWGARGMTYGC